MESNIRIIETLVVREEAERTQLWGIYKDAFERLNRRTPIHHGGYDAGEFDAVLLDEDFTKFLVYADDELAGVTLITNVLAKIPWVNAGYFEDEYPNRSRDKAIYFLPAVVIDPKHQDLRLIGAKLLQQSLTTLEKTSCWQSITLRLCGKACLHSFSEDWEGNSRARSSVVSYTRSSTTRTPVSRMVRCRFFAYAVNQAVSSYARMSSGRTAKSSIT